MKIYLFAFFFSALVLCANATSKKLSDFGYNTTNTTSFWKEALASDFDTIIIDNKGNDWRTESLKFYDLKNKTILFEKAAGVRAVKGAFNELNATLFSFIRCENIKIIGNSSRLLMNKDEYIALNNSEYRHGIEIINCSNIEISGLTVMETGGDGIYVGGANNFGDGKTYSENITIKNVRCSSNYRQGMSITSVQNMQIINCEFTNTEGTLPEAGLDIEPYETYHRIVNLSIKNSSFTSNNWAGIAIALSYLDATSLPVSITFDDCLLQNNGSPDHPYAVTEIYASSNHDSPVKGNVTFNKCLILSSEYSALYTRKTADAYSLVFNECVFNDVSKNTEQYNNPIFLEVPNYDKPSKAIGGIEFNNVSISYKSKFAAFRVYGWETLEGIKDITGKITLVAPNGTNKLIEKVKDSINFTLIFNNLSANQEGKLSVSSPNKIVYECTPDPVEITISLDKKVDYPSLVTYGITGTFSPSDYSNILSKNSILSSNELSMKINLEIIKDKLIEITEVFNLAIIDNAFTKRRDQTNFVLHVNDCNANYPLIDFDPAKYGSRVTFARVDGLGVHFLDTKDNTNSQISVFKRNANENKWVSLQQNIDPKIKAILKGSGSQLEEFQIRKSSTWTYKEKLYDAIGYAYYARQLEMSDFRGQMILLIADDVATNLKNEVLQLKKDLTSEGWLVNELIVPRAKNWDSGKEVVGVKEKIKSIYNSLELKPEQLFILGHVPLPRSGTDAITPDDHDENKGARGADTYYADIDGIYTDTATFNPGGLATDFAINLPGDYKWDQNFIPSELEMGFGRVDFADLTEPNLSEMELYKVYLNKLHLYKIADNDYLMGRKTAFFEGYDNSTDGAYRSLPSISEVKDILKKTNNDPHPKWVKENGPFLMYLQNLTVPDYKEWKQDGMDAVVYSSDQSYYGFGDVPQTGLYSRIRALLSLDNKNLINIWSTMAINMYPLLGIGECIGESTKRIMNHNDVNKLYDKPHQDFDNPAFWNRTHFTVYGDPTVRFFQVKPVKDVKFILGSDNIVRLTWTASEDTTILRYDVYQCTSEFGRYAKIGSVNKTDYSLFNYNIKNWYMVKAVKEENTPSGSFFIGSIGVQVEANLIPTNVKNVENISIKLSPNPASNEIKIDTDLAIKSFTINDLSGKLVLQGKAFDKGNMIDISLLNAGSYQINLEMEGNVSRTLGFVKM